MQNLAITMVTTGSTHPQPQVSGLDTPQARLALTVSTALALSFGIAIGAAALFVAAGVLITR
jgi:hypothetical protein